MVRSVDWQKLGSQLIRARRGARTQQQLSRALGYKSNAVFAWENGHDEPSARAFFQLATHTGGIGKIEAFYRDNVCPNLTDRDGIVIFLRGLIGTRKISEIAQLMDRDRHAVGRWLRGQTEISLPSLLHFVEVTTLSIYDFLAAFADVSQIEEAASGYAALESARESARQMPWAQAIVSMVDLPSYQALGKHQRGWFASRLGISIQEEQACLDHLVSKGQLELSQGRYVSGAALNVDTRPDPAATRQLASFWLKEGSERVLSPGRGRFAFNTFAVSEKDLAKAKELQSEYFRQLRALVAKSEPVEAVAVATFQLITLCVESENKS